MPSNYASSPYEMGGGTTDLPSFYASANTNCTWTSGQTDPRGGSAAYKFESTDAVTTNVRDLCTQNFGLGTSVDYYFSIFLKAAEVNYVLIQGWFDGLHDPGNDGRIVDLTDGSLTNTFGAWAPISEGIVDYGSGWYRYWFKSTTSASTGAQSVGIRLSGATTPNVTTPIGDGIYAYGAWLSEMDYPDWDSGITEGPHQIISDTSARTGATTTVTISSADNWNTPTSGNYLVAMVSARNDSGGALTFTTPSGFTAGPTDTSGTTQAAVFYKTSGGTETSTDFAVGDGGGTLVNMNATMIEISATGLTGLDGTAEDTSDVSSADTATPSGTVNATTPPGLAVAMIGTYRQDSRDGTPTWSNSYVSQAYTNAGQTARAGVAIATKVLTATGNTNTTYTTTDSATAYGALLVYNGTSTVGPIIQFHKLNNGF